MCSPNVSAAVRSPPPRHQHATHTCPADGPCALPVLYQELEGLWRQGGPSRSGQTPRTPVPPPSPPGSVYHSLSIVPVGAVPPPGAMALQRAVYRPRDAEHTVLHQVIAEHLEVFLRAVAEAGDGTGGGGRGP